MKNVYFINDGINPDTIYGSEYPVCLAREFIDRLAAEWERPDLINDFHVASEDEIEEYGVYEG